MHYMLYLLTANDNVDRAIHLSCEDDDAAIAEAGKYPHPLDRELCQGKRLVRRFAAPPIASENWYGRSGCCVFAKP